MGEIDCRDASARARCRRGTSTRRRHPEVQERSLAERRADRDHPCSGWPPARRRAIRRTCRAPKDWADESGWHLANKYGAAGSHRQVARLHDPAGRAGRMVAADRADRAHRTALGSRDRHPPRRQERRKVTHHALARLRPAGRHGHRALHQRPERRRRRPLHGVGGRQERRRDASRFWPSDAAGLEDHLGDALPRGRRGDHRRDRARRLVLPEGPGAEASRGARPVQHLQRLGAAARARSTSRRTR